MFACSLTVLLVSMFGIVEKRVYVFKPHKSHKYSVLVQYFLQKGFDICTVTGN